MPGVQRHHRIAVQRQVGQGRRDNAGCFILRFVRQAVLSIWKIKINVRRRHFIPAFIPAVFEATDGCK